MKFLLIKVIGLVRSIIDPAPIGGYNRNDLDVNRIDVL